VWVWVCGWVWVSREWGSLRSLSLTCLTCCRGNARRITARAANNSAFLFGGSAPNAGFLVAGQCIFEALALHWASGADGFGVSDLFEGDTGLSDREEDLWVGVFAGRHIAPVIGIPVHCVDERIGI
jgi:hypothetical protein